MDSYWNKRILGIDPGYAIVGFGLIQAGFGRYQHLRHGAITTPADLKAHERLVMIYEDMCALLDAMKPDEVSMEKLFFNTNTTTAMGVSQARGVILLSIAQRKIPIYEYSPSQIKQAIVGYGKAEKLQMMDMTRRLLNLPAMPKPDDAADGLAAALCHATMRTSQLYRE
ncbi:MAG: crossover junction endodeoxyribonuclease RuvC [Ruminococcaceae bacterium]|nr:crossover junction endodeoxyribonuclease RuvC [Oscillospiraceae bacterium]